jgi:glycosyltransferase involved in cell wall biosynthesis
MPVFPYALPSVGGRLRGRVVHTVHSIASREVEGRLRRSAHWLAFRAGVAPVAICDFVAQSIFSVYGVHPRATIPNGIPVRAFARPAGTGEAWRAANGIPGDAVVFVSVARFEAPKNTAALLDAFAALGDRPEGILLLVGDGPLRAELEERARALGIAERVRFTGSRRDIPEVLAASDVFVLASLFEGHPLSVMEAMAAGRPVVATSVGGVPEMVRSGETGILVPTGDVAALSGALRQMLESPELRRRMGASAARTAAEHFDISRMAGAYERLYEEILADRRTSAGWPLRDASPPRDVARPRA